MRPRNNHSRNRSAGAIKRSSFGYLARMINSPKTVSRAKKFAMQLIGLMHTPKGVRVLKGVLLDKKKPVLQRESAAFALAEIAKYENGKKAENFLAVALKREGQFSRLYNFLYLLLQEVKDAKAKRGIKGYISRKEINEFLAETKIRSHGG